MQGPVLLVTDTLDPERTTELRRALLDELPDADVRTATTPAETRDQIGAVDALVTLQVDDSLLAEADIEWVQSLSAGVDHFPQDALREAGIALTSASGVHAEPIGEQVLGYMLAFERDFLESRANQERGVWEPVAGGELQGKTVGVIGVGAIGTRVAELASAFGMTVLGTKHDLESMPDAVDESYHADDYRAVCQRADYLVLACPLTEETEGLVGSTELRLTPSDAVVVNVARGEVVDQHALLRALQYGTIRGAALDVFEDEPLPADSPLWTLSNVLVTPHMAGSTPKKMARWVDLIATNYRNLQNDDPLVNRIV